MKILLIGNYTKDKQESMLRFAHIMKLELQKRNMTVSLIQPTIYFGKLLKSNKGIGKWLGYIDKYIIFPFTLKKEQKKNDLVHILDQGNAIYLKYIHKKSLLTCCDILAIKQAKGYFPNHSLSWSGKILQKKISNNIKQAKNIVSISKKTQTDLELVLKKNSKVIHMGLNYQYKKVTQKPNYKNYFIHVGNNSWYKNRSAVLQIVSYLPHKFKLIYIGKKLTPKMTSFIKKHNLTTRVIVKENVSNEDLNILYSHSLGLIFPSLEEGFGWPILEAMASGCPVFTTNKPPMNEVGGTAAIYFIDIQNARECAQIILANLKKRELLIQRGIYQSKQFSTTKMIDLYINEYKRILRNEN